MADTAVSPIMGFIARFRAWTENTSQDADTHAMSGICTRKTADPEGNNAMKLHCEMP